MHKLSSVLFGTLKNKGIGRQVEAALICEMFNKLKGGIFPAEVAEGMCAKYVRGGTLMVAVLNPSIVQEVKLKQHDMFGVLEEKFGKKITRLGFLL